MEPRAGFDPATSALPRLKTAYFGILGDFQAFCEIDLQLAQRTVKDHIWRIKRVLESVNKVPIEISSEDLRGYLTEFKKNHAPATYAGVVKSMKVFFRDFLNMGKTVETFRFPSIEESPKTVPDKEQLRKFYQALESTRDKAIFLIFASSGLRKSEILSLKLENIDFEKRMIIPNKKSNRTKRNWVSFFNVETELVLRERINNLKAREQLFPSEKTLRRSWNKASEKSGVKITPQLLREWFCIELGALQIPDRYVDAFCGRVPKSVLARHYSDFNPERLRQVYEKANLKVLA